MQQPGPTDYLVNLILAVLSLSAILKYKPLYSTIKNTHPEKLADKWFKFDIIIPQQGKLLLAVYLFGGFILLGAPFRAPNLSAPTMFNVIVNFFAAPIWEEVFFRSILLNLLALLIVKIKISQSSADLISCFAVAIIFALFHHPSLGTQMPAGEETGRILVLAVRGLFYGLIYLSSGKNLLPSIVAHSSDALLITAYT